ncbi:MAG: hypothetical protein KBI39_00405 [Firmicutes bacterium]|nr:hypothetical protein [Candidatus Fermentithermobacillaceae bacterium]HON86711.1 hypothetical protein [Bacillota bacterium]HRC53565.1 hypothetical protein [Bacillota bacterium]
MGKRSPRAVSQGDVEILATLLIAFPQISRIVFDPKRRTLTLVFLCKGPIGKAQQRRINKLYRESIEVYHSLCGIESRCVSCSWDLTGELSSFQVERDVVSLSTGELSLTTSLISQSTSVFSAFDDSTLGEEPELSLSARFFVQELLEDIKNLECARQLVAVREGERVLVFDK